MATSDVLAFAAPVVAGAAAFAIKHPEQVSYVVEAVVGIIVTGFLDGISSRGITPWPWLLNLIKGLPADAGKALRTRLKLTTAIVVEDHQAQQDVLKFSGGGQ